MAFRNGRSSRHSNFLTRSVQGALNETSELAHAAGEHAADFLHDVNNTTLADVESRVTNYIQENPGRSVAMAAVAGAFFGFFWLRR